jgi:hypothetical protein
MWFGLVGEKRSSKEMFTLLIKNPKTFGRKLSITYIFTSFYFAKNFLKRSTTV